MVIKTIWYWHKIRKINQRSVIKSSEISQHVYGQLSLTSVPRIYDREKIVSSTNGVEKLDYPQAKE